MTNNCKFCKRNIEDINRLKINKKILELSSIFKNLNIDVINYILTFLIHQNGHIIEYKSSSKYLPLSSIKSISCSECFKRGIYKCLNHKNILPNLKFDIKYFYPRLKTLYEIKKIKNKKLYIPCKENGKVFLPNHYIITYWKQNIPKQKDGYYFIL